MDEDVTIGPLINEDGVKKVVNQLKDAESKGAKLSRSLDEAQEMGNFLKPVVVSNANQDMLAMQEETFGPIVPIATYSDLEDAIQMANDTQFGLAYFFTNDYRTGFHLYNSLDYGVIGWNDGGQHSRTIWRYERKWLWS